MCKPIATDRETTSTLFDRSLHCRFGTDRIARIVEVSYTMDETSRRPHNSALCLGTLDEISLRRLYAGPQYEMLINQHVESRMVYRVLTHLLSVEESWPGAIRESKEIGLEIRARQSV